MSKLWAARWREKVQKTKTKTNKKTKSKTTECLVTLAASGKVFCTALTSFRWKWKGTAKKGPSSKRKNSPPFLVKYLWPMTQNSCSKTSQLPAVFFPFHLFCLLFDSVSVLHPVFHLTQWPVVEKGQWTQQNCDLSIDLSNCWSIACETAEYLLDFDIINAIMQNSQAQAAMPHGSSAHSAASKYNNKPFGTSFLSGMCFLFKTCTTHSWMN